MSNIAHYQLGNIALFEKNGWFAQRENEPRASRALYNSLIFYFT